MLQRSSSPTQTPASNPLDGTKSYISSHGGDSKTARRMFRLQKSQINVGNVIQRLFGR